MRLTDVLIETGVVQAGVTLADAFRECVTHNVPGVPFCDAEGRVVGRVSVRHGLKMTCIPEYVVKGAHMLGDVLEGVAIKDEQIRSVLELPVDPYVLKDIAAVGPASPIVKALSVMEHYNSSYIFVLEGECYLGIVTRLGIARLMLRSREE